MDRSFNERNRAATVRIRKMANLSDEQMKARVGEHWTVAMALVHLAYWDRRALFVLDGTERDGKLFAPAGDELTNDLLLPLLAAIPPQEAVRIAVEAAEAIDRRLEDYPEALLEQVTQYNQRWVNRYLHREGHLDEVDAALKGSGGRA